MTTDDVQDGPAPTTAGAPRLRAALGVSSFLLWTALAVVGYLLVLRDDDRGLIVLVVEATAAFVAYGLSLEPSLARWSTDFTVQVWCLAIPSVPALVSLATVYIGSH